MLCFPLAKLIQPKLVSQLQTDAQCRVLSQLPMPCSNIGIGEHIIRKARLDLDKDGVGNGGGN